ncbi:MAG: MGMT family protein [Anaerolineae bacterium]|nr:MGMT family protein [Anaerolineae bacterium]
MPPDKETYDQTVWLIVWQIPYGHVFTYGQIAAMIPAPEGVELPSYERIAPRWVGYAMNRAMSSGLNVPQKPGDPHIPWQRVINSRGGISLAEGSYPATQQRVLLEGEGVSFNAQNLVDFNQYGWDGPDDDWLTEHGFFKPHSMKKQPPDDHPSQLSLF